jgi:dimeric dUTPase (all-alpha-NTP-PPase superfamily)
MHVAGGTCSGSCTITLYKRVEKNVCVRYEQRTRIQYIEEAYSTYIQLSDKLALAAVCIEVSCVQKGGGRC